MSKSEALAEVSKELLDKGENQTKAEKTSKPTAKSNKPTKTKETSFSGADVKKMLDEHAKQFAQQSKELEKRLLGKITSHAGKPEDYIDGVDVDIDDVLKEPVIFFSYSQGKTIMDDKRHGRVSYPPFSQKMIVEGGGEQMVPAPYHFKKMFHTERFGTRNRREIVWVCQCTVESKKRVEWLRKHTMFNVGFFEKIQNALTVDAFLQEKLVEAAMYARQLTDAVVIQRCMNDNLPVDTNIDAMRSALSRKIAERSILNDKDKSRMAVLQTELTNMSKGNDNASNNAFILAKTI